MVHDSIEITDWYVSPKVGLIKLMLPEKNFSCQSLACRGFKNTVIKQINGNFSITQVGFEA